MTDAIAERLRQKLGASVLASVSERGEFTFVLDPARLLEAAFFLRDDQELAFDLPIDCTAIDWFQKREPRFEVVYNLYSMRHHHRVRLKILVHGENPSVPSLTAVWRGMNWHERECFDMYGIIFTGHPKLERLLMYEEFEGHPLRKDYPIDKRQPLVPLRAVRAVPTQRQAPPDLLNEP